jgi:hypothetical protein
MIPAIVTQAAVKLIAKQFKLDKVLDYVEKPNDADERIDSVEIDNFKLQKRVELLEKASHEPRTIVRCEECGKKIKESE